MDSIQVETSRSQYSTNPYARGQLCLQAIPMFEMVMGHIFLHHSNLKRTEPITGLRTTLEIRTTILLLHSVVPQCKLWQSTRPALNPPRTVPHHSAQSFCG